MIMCWSGACESRATALVKAPGVTDAERYSCGVHIWRAITDMWAVTLPGQGVRVQVSSVPLVKVRKLHRRKVGS